jgi:predicted nucleic acid-binding Zn ribbon protein
MNRKLSIRELGILIEKPLHACSVCGNVMPAENRLCQSCLEAKEEADRINKELARERAFPISWF